jgi:citrate/tricarballylate utilization protein
VTPLESLVREAEALAASNAPIGAHALRADEAEVARQLQICNACRYCEGYCAVFPAMTRRLEFAKADIHYLANLCHNCGACLHACQYAPPHEFAVNVPRAMARVRVQTYTDYAWPRAWGAAYRRNGLVIALALAAGLAVFLALAVALTGAAAGTPPRADFYAVFAHGLMVSMFAPVFLFALGALAVGVRRFWIDLAPGSASGAAARDALHHTLALTYLNGGHREGCNEADDRYTLWRRRWHHLTFYGFMLCFAATCVATLDHYLLGARAPYPMTSLPVLLGTAGGIGLLLGPAGLLWLNLRRHPMHGDPAQHAMDRGFIALLLLTSLSGLALLAWRYSAAMTTLLAVHLGIVMALFMTMPYGKFAHGVFRVAALLKWSIERRQPSRIRLGAE